MSSVLTKKKKRAVLLFILPGLTLLTIFIIIPFFMSFGLSFTNQRILSRTPTQFIGLSNYQRLFKDDLFFRGLINNMIFALIVVPIQMALSLGMAMAVNKNLKGVKIFRTAYFMPTVTTMVVVSVVWSFMYNPQGLINNFMQTVTFGRWETVDFLKDSSWAFPSIMLMSIWQGAGFQMLIFLAGLQEIPRMLYEASMIDGAGKWKQFLHITLPQLKNTTTFVLISTTILSLRLFDQVKIMTNGGPSDTTYTVILHLYNSGFTKQKVGYASAMTVVFFLIVLVISIIQRVLLREEREV
ncbi:MAG TPA: sugar ABC transporter permease [Thermotogota bacterium]|nr:sugar ABC transporter permease [Thermotogota bacterium]HPR96919.1 sugar ABC transporter permease [Thermotogota bacterium]